MGKPHSSLREGVKKQTGDFSLRKLRAWTGFWDRNFPPVSTAPTSCSSCWLFIACHFKLNPTFPAFPAWAFFIPNWAASHWDAGSHGQRELSWPWEARGGQQTRPDQHSTDVWPDSIVGWRRKIKLKSLYPVYLSQDPSARWTCSTKTTYHKLVWLWPNERLAQARRHSGVLPITHKWVRKSLEARLN